MDISHIKTIYKCPQCGELTGSHQLISTNTLGARIYSDGYTSGVMYDESPAITKCGKCSTIYWLEKNIIGEYNMYTTKNPEWQKATDPEELEGDDLFMAVKDKVYTTKEEELYLRYQLWVNLNRQELNKGEQKIYESNCKKLIKLYNMENIDEKLRIAELYRNIGNFAECVNILKTVKNKDYSRTKKLLLEESKKENRETIRLTD